MTVKPSSTRIYSNDIVMAVRLEKYVWMVTIQGKVVGIEVTAITLLKDRIGYLEDSLKYFGALQANVNHEDAARHRAIPLKGKQTSKKSD